MYLRQIHSGRDIYKRHFSQLRDKIYFQELITKFMKIKWNKIFGGLELSLVIYVLI